MKTTFHRLKWIAITLSALLVFHIHGCSKDDSDRQDKRCFTVLDVTNDSPIKGASIWTRYKSSNGTCISLTYRTDENGEACIAYPTLCYGHVSASGYIAKEFPAGNIPTIIKLVPL